MPAGARPGKPDRPDRHARSPARFDSLTTVTWADVVVREPGPATLGGR